MIKDLIDSVLVLVMLLVMVVQGVNFKVMQLIMNGSILLSLFHTMLMECKSTISNNLAIFCKCKPMSEFH